MFDLISKLKKFRYFSQKHVDEINILQELCITGKDTEILKLDWRKLCPETTSYDSIKLMFHFLAAASLKNEIETINIFSVLVFGKGLDLCGGEDQKYLKLYSHNILRITFGDGLKGFPRDIRRYEPALPLIDKVTDDVKTRFIMTNT